MAIRKVTDSQGHVLWPSARQVTVRGMYCGYKECKRQLGTSTVAIRKVTACQGPVLRL